MCVCGCVEYEGEIDLYLRLYVCQNVLINYACICTYTNEGDVVFACEGDVVFAWVYVLLRAMH